MIRPLRQRHRHIVMALGIFLPVAFSLGIAARKPVPSVTSLPDSLTAAPATFTATAWQRSDLFATTPIQVRLLREPARGGRLGVALSAAKNFLKPDLIVYWVGGSANLTDVLPDNAILLGNFNATPFRLPEEIVKSNGRLVLFSLADGEIVAVSIPFKFEDE